MRRKMEDKSQIVFDYIQSYIGENGYAPTVREVCSACQIASTATAYHYINKLRDEGLIFKKNNKNRAVSVMRNTVSVPLIGTVAAGQPIFATENYEDTFSLPKNFFPGDDLFMLNVQGDSMIKAGIFNGDKLVVQKQATAQDGDIVVALVDDSATVKRLFRKNGKIILHPENDQMSDFVFDEVSILGRVIGLLRNI